MAVIKEPSASWLVEMWYYISYNPEFLVNGFLHSGISNAFDGDDDDTSVPEDDSTTDTSDEDALLCMINTTIKCKGLMLNYNVTKCMQLTVFTGL